MQTVLVDYFPRAHTAIAEWLACIVFMLPLKKRFNRWQTALLYLGMLAAFLVTNQDKAPFLMIIILDFLYMLVMIGVGCKLTWTEIGYYWAHIFITSEFAASAEWQINYYLLAGGVITQRWQTYICLTLVDFGGLVMLYAHNESRREVNLRLELEAMESLLNRQYEQYRQFDMNNRTLHRIYHDLKHQLTFIRAEQNEEKRASSLSELVHAIDVYESEVNTGSSVLDTLLTSKNILCKEYGITMICYADAHDLQSLDVMDICAIFGNAIDNAIECEQKIESPDKRLIKVNVYTQNRFLLIRVENYCEDQVAFDSGLPVTTKPDVQMHGYGVKSIKRSVEKYGGHLNLEQEDSWFRITALIPLGEGQA